MCKCEIDEYALSEVIDQVSGWRTADDSACPGKFWEYGAPVWITQIHYAKPNYEKHKNGCVVVEFSDGSKSISKCSTLDEYSPETGLALCLLKRFMGKDNVRSLLNNWIPDEAFTDAYTNITLKEVRKNTKENR